MRRGVLVPVVAATLACGAHAFAGEHAADRLHERSERASVWGRQSWATVHVSRALDGQGDGSVTLSYSFAGILFPDGVYRGGSCSLPAGTFDVDTSGPNAGTALLEADLALADCAWVTPAPSRLLLTFTPIPGGEETHVHRTSVVHSGGSRFHVQGRESSYRVAMLATIDGFSVGPFSPTGPVGDSSVRTYRRTSVTKAP